MPPLNGTSLRLIRTLDRHTQSHARQLLQLHPLLQVTSARRSVSRNRAVGGSPSSWHLQGRAIDIVGPQLDLERAAGDAWRLRLGPRCTGPEEVLLEFLGTPRAHLHVAW